MKHSEKKKKIKEKKKKRGGFSDDPKPLVLSHLRSQSFKKKRFVTNSPFKETDAIYERKKNNFFFRVGATKICTLLIFLIKYVGLYSVADKGLSKD